MKKSVKIFLLIFIVLIFIILLDTAQSKFFDNRPLIKITKDYNGGNVYKIDKGIFVYTYNFSDGKKETVFRWEKYAPPFEEEITVDLQKEENEIESENNMSFNINIVIDEKTYNAVLEENKTVESFINMLPQEYNMNELNGNEKYVYLGETLPTNSYNPKHIEKGDIMLYGNNCLVVFYKSFETPYSYTKIGHIENLPNLTDTNMTIKFEKQYNINSKKLS